jgi:hypothetical protein
MDETHVVSARDEWKARTAAMMFYVQPLRGNAVSYTVKEMG